MLLLPLLFMNVSHLSFISIFTLWHSFILAQERSERSTRTSRLQDFLRRTMATLPKAEPIGVFITSESLDELEDIANDPAKCNTIQHVKLSLAHYGDSLVKDVGAYVICASATYAMSWDVEARYSSNPFGGWETILRKNTKP